ncbi:SGNH/GDSL hydrolase family protein [Planococcus sp. YIM B11945]|uniref:SGNH/GDSL hydrolase family protein n=1 Tax=Planococcus sp. YIM B11945 TaxID=3435410 RepID=UPI003D7DB32D
MNLRNLGAFVLIVLCLAVLVFSYIIWKDKLASASGNSSAPAVEVQKEEPAEAEEPVSEGSSQVEFEKLTAAMDEQVREVFVNRNKAGEKVQLLIVGSSVMEDGEPGYAKLLMDSLEEAYGDFVEAETISFDGTSLEFLEEDVDLSKGYDVVLMEPFTLKDNGNVTIEDEQFVIEKFLGKVQAEVSDAALVLHPPQPIFQAKFYLAQVEALEEFANLNDYAYINHWSNWPDTEDPALEDYLTEDSDPNGEGAAIWADSLSSYFIAE